MSAIARKPAELFVDPAVILEARPDGSRLFRSKLELPGFARCSGEWLERWAAETPDAILIAERGADGEWVKVTMARPWRRVYRIATWLLGQKLSPERPVLVLSDNGIEHALLMLACLHVGVPISPVSPGNSLLSKDFLKLKANVELLRPGVIFADTIERFLPAINAVADLHDGVVVAGSRSAAAGRHAALRRDRGEPLRRHGEAAVKAAFAAGSAPDTIAKFLFTSGSVGTPKAVINTQRMMCSNAEMKSIIWPFLNTQKPGDLRLAAVEPRLRRQPQFQQGGALGRQPLHRRRQAAAGPAAEDRAQPHRCLAHHLFQRAAGLRPAGRPAARQRRLAQELLLAACRSSSTPAPRCRNRPGTNSNGSP
jgi:feruloyl-CoA synthase